MEEGARLEGEPQAQRKAAAGQRGDVFQERGADASVLVGEV